MLAIAIAVCAVAIACDTRVKIEGTVRNHQGNPLKGVTVTLQTEGRGPHRTLTESDGSFAVGIVGADPAHINLVFQKQGYRTLQLPFDTKQANMQVTLEAETAGTH